MATAVGRTMPLLLEQDGWDGTGKEAIRPLGRSRVGFARI